MSEWKGLKIDNIPPDILTGDYEISDYDSYHSMYIPTKLHPIDCLSNILTSEGAYRYYYRKPEPKAHSHEEIMTKWWKTEYPDGYSWDKVDRFISPCEEEDPYCIHNEFVDAEWFTGRESSEIPPE